MNSIVTVGALRSLPSMASTTASSCFWMRRHLITPRHFRAERDLHLQPCTTWYGWKNNNLSLYCIGWRNKILSKRSSFQQQDIAILKQTGSTAAPGQAVQVRVAQKNTQTYVPFTVKFHTTKLSLTPSLTTTTSSTRRRFSPKDRQCYFEDEVKLAHLPNKDGYRWDFECHFF